MLLISFLLNWIVSKNPTPDANPIVANASEVWCLPPTLPLGGSRQAHRRQPKKMSEPRYPQPVSAAARQHRHAPSG